MSSPKDFILRVGDSVHFKNSSKQNIWGINSKHSFGKFFIKNAKSGDRLWFVKSKSNGLIIAVSTFTHIKERELGPLIAVTQTNEELGWTKQKGEWDTELHYKDLYDVSMLGYVSDIKGTSTIRMYNEKCKVNLPEEYPLIVRYSKVIVM